ncbi:glycosyltransferase family A protein [uncultured Psychrobacter sp.]|uniref:glycosyltransferase family 2 protein n=1 Tax=uncultured Psychrobacter sp. TaxID=259303 RepID=UPI0025960F83|nr:glycosyltransferase family A protein [uncultured Psychrobacter sp.]
MFTVVIPLYNKEKYIRRAVDSVLSQSYEDFELIIINDGSTDKSLEQLKDITDSRMRIINQTNGGVGAARNEGIKNSKYPWIALLDADDIWAIDHLEELKNIVKEYPSSGLISNQIRFVEENSTNILNGNLSVSNIRSIDYFKEAAKNLSIVTSSSVCINKIVFEEIGGFLDSKMGEDLEYWARIAFSYPIAISDKITSYYVRGTGGVTENQNYNSYKRLNSLAGVSPSINLIIEKSKQDPSILKQPNIVSYINSRLLGGVKVWLYHENIAAAKNLSKLALPHKDAKYLTLYFITKTPESMLKTVIKSYKLLKQ